MIFLFLLNQDIFRYKNKLKYESCHPYLNNNIYNVINKYNITIERIVKDLSF